MTPVSHVVFFYNATPTPQLDTLSLHDALPISRAAGSRASIRLRPRRSPQNRHSADQQENKNVDSAASAAASRSEEHTSELQSHVNLVCRLLLEKKKTNLVEDQYAAPAGTGAES